MTRKAYVRTCEECGKPHTYCKEDRDGLMVCDECQENAKLYEAMDGDPTPDCHACYQTNYNCYFD